MDVPINVLYQIPEYAQLSNIKPFDKGGSGDQKWIADFVDGQRVVIRIAKISNDNYDDFQVCSPDIDKYLRICEVYKLCEEHNIPSPHLLGYGTVSDGEYFYMLITWLDGIPADEVIGQLSSAEQYELGRKCGAALALVHQIPAPDDALSFYDWKQAHVSHHKERQHDGGANPAHLFDAFFTYLEANKATIYNRPQTLLHGDFALCNSIILPNGEIALIDFASLQRNSHFGDPWSEVECAETFSSTPAYRSGVIDGYFNGNIPIKFWDVRRYYTVFYALELILYSPADCIPEAERYFAESKDQIPEWYLDAKKDL